MQCQKLKWNFCMDWNVKIVIKMQLDWGGDHLPFLFFLIFFHVFASFIINILHFYTL